MAVEKDVTRKCVNISWDTSIVLGDKATIVATNVETGGKGGPGEQNNDGFFPLTYPIGYTGASDVTVTGSDGGEDTGTIEVGSYVPLEPGEPGAPPVDPSYGVDVDEGFGDRPHIDQSLPGDQPEINPLDKKN